MDKLEFDERVLRLHDVGQVIGALPAEIRSEAFGMLKGYVSGRREPDNGDAHDQNGADIDSGADTSLFSRFDHDKPSDNVRLIAAHLFQMHGSEPFSIEEMSAIAAETGITVPARIDKTLLQAAENGKHLFVIAGSYR